HLDHRPARAPGPPAHAGGPPAEGAVLLPHRHHRIGHHDRGQARRTAPGTGLTRRGPAARVGGTASLANPPFGGIRAWPMPTSPSNRSPRSPPPSAPAA